MKATIATNSSNSLKGFGFYLFHAQDEVNFVLFKENFLLSLWEFEGNHKKFIKRVNKI